MLTASTRGALSGGRRLQEQLQGHFQVKVPVQKEKQTCFDICSFHPESIFLK